MKNKKLRGASIRALVGWELRQRRWSLLWWTVGFGVLVALIMLVYPTFSDQAADLNESFGTIPDSAKQLFTDTPDLFSPVGYLSSQLFYLMAPIIFSGLAIGLGASLLAREESATTIELLLSRPISRGRLVFAKALAGLIAFAGVSGAMVVVSLACASAVEFKDVTAGNIALTMAMAAALSLVFGAVAFFITALGKLGRGAAIGIAGLVAIASYLASSLDKTVEWLQVPAKFLPFHYYHPAEVLTGDFRWLHLGIMMASVLAFGLLAWVAFRRRDLE